LARKSVKPHFIFGGTPYRSRSDVFLEVPNRGSARNW
jgi:hypothetical protein